MFYLRQIASPSNLIPKYTSIFKYPPPFLCFAFLYSHHDTRFFTEEFCVKLYRKYKHTKEFSLRICKVAYSIQTKEMSLDGSEFSCYQRKINLGKKNSSQTCHFHMVICVGRNYLYQNYLMASFNVNLCC